MNPPLTRATTLHSVGSTIYDKDFHNTAHRTNFKLNFILARVKEIWNRRCYVQKVLCRLEVKFGTYTNWSWRASSLTFWSAWLLRYLTQDVGVDPDDDEKWHEVHHRHAEEVVHQFQFGRQDPKTDALIEVWVLRMWGDVENVYLERICFHNQVSRTLQYEGGSIST